MPQIRKLSPAEVETLEYKPKGTRKLVEAEYDAILSDYAVGDYGEAQLEPEEKRLTVRNRLIAAARRRGLGITFRRTSGDRLHFQIVAQNGVGDTTPPKVVPAMLEPIIESVPAPKRRGGRSKKTV